MTILAFFFFFIKTISVIIYFFLIKPILVLIFIVFYSEEGSDDQSSVTVHRLPPLLFAKMRSKDRISYFYDGSIQFSISFCYIYLKFATFPLFGSRETGRKQNKKKKVLSEYAILG